MRNVVACLVLALSVALGGAAAGAQTLQAVKARGFLICGTNPGLGGFAAPDATGRWAGLDVDLCRAIAAAIFDDPDKVKFAALTAKDRFVALQTGEVDVLIRNTTWTFLRDTQAGLNFTGINYFDGQGFIVHKDLPIRSARDLAGASVCVESGTTSELNLADYARANGIGIKTVAFALPDEAIGAYLTRRCDAFTTDASALHAGRLMLRNPEDHVLLPDIISKEPLGPAVRQGDDQWFDIVKWVHFAMLNAEELGIAQANIGGIRDLEHPDVRRLLGIDGNFGAQLGLPDTWAASIVRHVGNYGEVFERNLGQGSPLKIPRGLNALWSRGGLQYAPPIR